MIFRKKVSISVKVVRVIKVSKVARDSSDLKAPFIINSENLKACQIILEDEQYLIKYPIYETLKNSKE